MEILADNVCIIRPPPSYRQPSRVVHQRFPHHQQVQRIPRYCLLLQEMKKNTPEDDPQWNSVNIALEKVKKITMEMNESKRRFENLTELLDIQNRIRTPHDFVIIKPHRRCIKKGELQLVIRERDYRIFLFNDMLLRTSIAYNVKETESLAVLSIKQSDMLGPKLFTVMKDSATAGGEPTTWMVLMAKTEAERDLWVSALQEAIHNAKQIHSE